MQNKQIKIEIKTVYGQDKLYPACETSKLLSDLTGLKTFTKHNLETIKALGYEVVDATPRKTF